MQKQLALRIATLVFSALTGTLLIQPAQAQYNPNTQPVYEQWADVQAQNYAWWNSLSEREQSIVHAAGQIIVAYQQQTGQSVYPSQENTLQIMRMIGANDQDYNLVLQTLNSNYQYFSANQELGGVFDEYQGYINCLMSGRLDCY